MQHIWHDCSRLLESELTPQQFSAWIKPLKALDFDESTATLTIGAPNRLKLDAIRAQFSDQIAQAASRVVQRPVAVVFAVENGTAVASAALSGGDAWPGERRGARARRSCAAKPGTLRARATELEPDLRHLRHRQGEPAGARRGDAGCGEPRRLVQPAVPLRRRGPRQDAPDPRGRQRHPGAQARCQGALHPRRAVRQRRRARLPAQGLRRLQALLPLARPAADRRHPVLRRQGTHAGRVLLCVRGARRRPQADHHHLRHVPEGTEGHGRPPGLPLRFGTDGRDRAARARDARGDPAEEGRDRRRRA